MRTHKIVFAFLLFCFSGLISFASFAESDSNPVALLQSIANRMIAGLKVNKATLKTNPRVVYSLANRIVVPYADLDEMSRRVLPPQVWAQATPTQRIQFKREFTTLLIRTYASALAAYKDQVVQFYPIRGGYAGKSVVEVSSDIVNDGPSIHVVYRLVRKGGSWRLYDMSVEGVSLIESFRSQFADILSQGGNMDQLLNRIRAKTGRRS